MPVGARRWVEECQALKPLAVPLPFCEILGVCEMEGINLLAKEDFISESTYR
jgi:hypothetical protein